MIDPNELRIGNLYKPDVLGDPEYDIITASDIDELATDPLDDYYQPLPLTGEWLLKAGAKKVRETEYCLQDNDAYVAFIYDKVQHYWWGIYHNGDVSTPLPFKMKYMHELQNFWRFFTNNELEIKL